MRWRQSRLPRALLLRCRPSLATPRNKLPQRRHPLRRRHPYKKARHRRLRPRHHRLHREGRAAATRCRARRLPLRFRRALPRREVRRLCGAPLPASQCTGAVSGMQKCRDSDGRRRRTAAAAAAPPIAPEAAPVRPPLGPIPPVRPRRALTILQICGVEQETLCGDIPAGGGRIIACLAANAPRLSPACYNALSVSR
jgi:hypothetical protein